MSLSRNQRRTGLSPLGKKVLGASFLVATIAGITHYTDFPEFIFSDNTVVVAESKNVKQVQNNQQSSETLRLPINGRDYTIWEGVVIEEMNNKESSNYWTDFDHHIYDFDLRVVMHTSIGKGGISRTLFKDTVDETGKISPHLERVRHYGCRIAVAYNERAASDDYGPTPGDVTAYYERHCRDYKPQRALEP